MTNTTHNTPNVAPTAIPATLSLDALVKDKPGDVVVVEFLVDKDVDTLGEDMVRGVDVGVE